MIIKQKTKKRIATSNKRVSNGPEEPWYRILYDDDNEEEATEEELRAKLHLYELKKEEDENADLKMKASLTTTSPSKRKTTNRKTKEVHRFKKKKETNSTGKKKKKKKNKTVGESPKFLDKTENQSSHTTSTCQKNHTVCLSCYGTFKFQLDLMAILSYINV